MKRVVIDGATSMLGLALIEECIVNHVEVLAIVRPNSRRLWSVPKSDLVQVVECELWNLKFLEIETIEPYETYFHFAWGNTYSEDRKDVQLQEPNIQFTLDSIELAYRLGCKRYIGAGSQAEYGRVEGIIGPDTPVHPDVAYGIAKYAAGRMAMILCEKLDMECIWTRTFSVYGAGDSMKTLVMYAISTLLKGEKPSFTKAEQQWDFLYSKDAGRAFYLIGERGKKGKIYCIASGKTRILKEYIQILRDAVDPKLPIGIGEKEYAPLQVMTLKTDISELQEDTGFEPRYTFEQGINTTITWVKNHKGLEKE